MEENRRPQENEPKVMFRSITDRDVFIIVNQETDKTLVEISGYDLQINFNMEYLNSVQDIEAASQGLKDMFKEIMLEQVFKEKKQNQQ